MLQPGIKSVRGMKASVLYIEYENGEKRIFDVKPYITGSWFGELADEDYFNTVHVLPGGSGIEWENGQDIAPHELYECSVEAK